ncbi:hypothetical protein GYB29_10695 [bacterium]|nr:hypothetical protein [bacterium]
MIKEKLPFYRDPEFWFILAYNLVILYLYITGRVDPHFVIWAYYLQSVYIGLQYVVHSFIYTKRTTGSIFPLKKMSMTFFFVVHYGLFHFVYFVFLVVMSAKSEDVVNLIDYIKLTLGFLAVNLLFFAVREALPTTPVHKAPSFLLPYARIAPIHIFIIVGMNADFILDGFTIFILLKIFFDMVVYAFTGGEQREA